MAKVTPIHPIASISGAIVKEDGSCFRTRNGKTHVYKVVHPFKGEPTENQNSMRKIFGDCVRQASVILHSPELRAEWQTRYDEYLKDVTRHPQSYPKPSSTLRGFIISQLHKK